MRRQRFTLTMMWVHWDREQTPYTRIKWPKQRREKGMELVFQSPQRSQSLSQTCPSSPENLKVLELCFIIARRFWSPTQNIFWKFESVYNKKNWHMIYFAQAVKEMSSQCLWSQSLSWTTGRLVSALVWSMDSLWTGRRFILKPHLDTSRSWRVSTSSWKLWADKDSGPHLTHWGLKFTITSSTTSIQGYDLLQNHNLQYEITYENDLSIDWCQLMPLYLQ